MALKNITSPDTSKKIVKNSINELTKKLQENNKVKK